jgi:DNA-binding NtrC family response regulator
MPLWQKYLTRTPRFFVRSVVFLSRRQRLYGAAANWLLPDVELFLFDSPSEALARIALGKTAVFLFDTRDYPRYKHVMRKFFSMKKDSDVVILGQQELDFGMGDEQVSVAVRPLPLDSDPEEIHQVVHRLLQLRNVRESSGIVGRSQAINETLSLIAHAAPLDVNILVLGESGTGKELVAQAIHDNSIRKSAPFISLNCGAVSEGVLESELFGHVRGAFTGAVADNPGVFKRANGGTLFLDEVAEMPLGMQTRFLRALETGEFTPVGGRSTQKSDIRLVAATHQDLANNVAQGTFRQDLYYRLRVVVINTPPLRQHKEDIPILVDKFLSEENSLHGLHVKGLTRSAEQALMDHQWPGNVRELRNTIRSLVVLKQRGMIDVPDLPVEISQGHGPYYGPTLPVPLSKEAPSAVDISLLASTLLEIQQELREIKTMLQADHRPVSSDSGWQVADDGRLKPVGDIVETYAHGSDFGPFVGEQAKDLQTAERTLIEAALETFRGNRRQAADSLGISERTLYRKIKTYGLA